MTAAIHTILGGKVSMNGAGEYLASLPDGSQIIVEQAGTNQLAVHHAIRASSKDFICQSVHIFDVGCWIVFEAIGFSKIELRNVSILRFERHSDFHMHHLPSDLREEIFDS